MLTDLNKKLFPKFCELIINHVKLSYYVDYVCIKIIKVPKITHFLFTILFSTTGEKLHKNIRLLWGRRWPRGINFSEK